MFPLDGGDGSESMGKRNRGVRLQGGGLRLGVSIGRGETQLSTGQAAGQASQVFSSGQVTAF